MIVEAKPVHVAQIARCRSIGERARSMGVDAKRQLRAFMSQSSFRRAWLHEGQCLGIGGVIGTALSTDGLLWLALHDDAARYPKQIMRHAILALSELFQTYRRVTARVLSANAADVAFAERFGFRLGPAQVIDRLVMRQGTLTRERFHTRDRVQTVSLPASASSASPFIIFALPRSRTKWLSVFLTQGPWVCGHDLIADVGAIGALRNTLAIPCTGTVETDLAFAWPLIRKWFPSSRFAVVRRPIGDVARSLAAHGWHMPAGHLEAVVAKLEEISALPATLTVDFSALSNEETCRTLWSHCVRSPWDRQRWLAHRDRNIQIDIPARMAALAINRDRIEAVIHRAIALTASLTMQHETFDEIWPAARNLVAEHYQEVGDRNGIVFDPDPTQARAAYSAGAVQFTTLRAGPQIVGYVVFHISPSWESRGTLCAYQGTFFVAREFRGLGLKLHAFARASLSDRGVKEIILRAGTRGDGPKLDGFFKRIGAVENARLYSMTIGN